MTKIKLLPNPINRLNTFCVHLFLSYCFCIFLQGQFLFTFPTLFVVWLILSGVMTQLHYGLSLVLRAKFFHENYIVALWMLPLLYMLGGVLALLLLLLNLDIFEQNGVIRQSLQLDLQSYSKSIYLYILLLVSSGTLLFVKMTHESIPLFQAFHHNKKSQRITRLSLIFLVGFIIFSLIYLFSFAKNNVTFIRAYFQSVYSNDSYIPLNMYKMIKKGDRNRLYFNARLRMARMSFRRFRNYKQAISYLDEIIDSDSPLKDEAMLEKIRVFMSMQNQRAKIEKTLNDLRLLNSCLLDEALFLYASVLEGAQEFSKAKEVYKELMTMNYSLTIVSFINSEHLDFARTKTRAKKKLNGIKGL
ncbi:MAG: hypothetical protein KC646_13195 [Candidatus Cloacimonetes bacterium]|nr:hypothetical protein [Candidatus Cloacimonadota bacterium]